MMIQSLNKKKWKLLCKRQFAEEKVKSIKMKSFTLHLQDIQLHKHKQQYGEDTMHSSDIKKL